MKQDLLTRLRERHPSLFSSPPDTPLGERGIEVGDGWFELLAKSFGDIERAAQSSGVDAAHLVQVKEKFGLLRIYVQGPSHDAIDDVLQRAEQASTVICEACGRNGNLVSDIGWLRVRCHPCRDRRQS